MSSEEDRVRRYNQKVKDRWHDDNDFKGPFKNKPVDARRTEYTRKRLNPREAEMYDDEYEA